MLSLSKSLFGKRRITLSGKTKNRLIDVIIFFCCYIVSFVIQLLLGIKDVSFGTLIHYSIIFFVIECLELLFWDKRFQFILFFVNVYVSYCITSILLNLIQTGQLLWKNAFAVDVGIYFLLVLLSLMLSALGFIVLFIRFMIKRKRDSKAFSKN